VGDVARRGRAGDGARNSADVLVLVRGISESDLDADGLSPQLEALVGTSPLVADSDGDGTADHLEDFDQDGSSNSAEFLAGTDATRADTDGDGIVDSRDARPTTFDGDRAVWVHTDHLGSVSVLSDQTGAVLRRITYEVWGAVRSNLPTPGMASLDSAEKYTGQRYDAETSLYYYGARYYDPGLGRFIGADA
jgi:RHS repeat-associated protein